MKLKLILITVLAFGSMAHAQGIMSNLSVGVGFEGVFPAATFDSASYNTGNGGNPPAQKTTNSVGVVVDARYDFGRHSALGASFSLNRSKEIYLDNAQTVSWVQSNNAEMIGTYIFRLPYNETVKPYAMFGGGLVRFGPNGTYSASGTPQAEMKAAFAYGFGSDFKMTDHWGLRLQYRGLLRADPSFKLGTSSSTSGGFGTGLKAHVPEPSIQVVYHF